jgi:carboxypeptidase Taq
MTRAYDQLETRFHQASVIGDALSMLHWDMATMMPDGSAASRAEQSPPPESRRARPARAA